MNQPQEKTGHVKTIRELLGMEGVDFPMPGHGPISPSGPAPALNLPVEGIEEQKEKVEEHEQTREHAREVEDAEFTPVEEAKAKRKGFFNRDWVRYPIIFVVAVGFFYLVLNFRSLSQQFVGTVKPPETNQEKVLGPNTVDFTTWIAAYYAVETDQEKLAANADPDGDGLTNVDEYYMSTNPLRADTDRDMTDDGDEVLFGSNPLYEGDQTAIQSQTVADHIDLAAVQSRKNFDSGPQESEVAGETVKSFVVDTSLPGQISIPRLEIDAPVTWSASFDTMEEDLKHGVVHHPETPYPGEEGTASIHGHSSGNFDDGNFKTVFTRINMLEPGDDVFVTVYSIDGETRKYRFVVRSKKVYSKTDSAQFNAGEGSFLNISTSWPIGTSRERFVVTTELQGL